MAHIANLKKRAAAFGLTIVKQGDGRDTGYSEYTLAANELDHDNSYMFSLDGIARLIEACESFPAASPDQIKAILVHDNPLKYAGELLRIHKQDQEAMRADIEVGDSVSFSSMSDATWFTVIEIDRFDMQVKQEGVRNYAPKPADKSMVKQVRKAESIVIPECGVASEKDSEPLDLMVKRAPSYPEAVLKRVVTAAIASGEKPVENIPAEPAKPYDSAIGTYTTPYGEGQEAFKAGKRWYENPYPGGSVESYQWDRGHTSVRCPELATAKPVHSHDLLCEAALCIWENMLEIRHGKPSLDETWDKFGTVAMRHAAIALAPAACSIWDMMSEDERQECIPYDWEFIPAFVSLVKWDEWIDFGTSALAGGVDLESVKASILKSFAKES